MENCILEGNVSEVGEDIIPKQTLKEI